MSNEPTERVDQMLSRLPMLQESNDRWAESEKNWRKASEARQFGSRVRGYRRRAGLSRAEAVQRARGISSSVWAEIESGRTNPLAIYQKALKRLQVIASAVGRTLEELTKEGEAP